jgi:hypothetical protein
MIVPDRRFPPRWVDRLREAACTSPKKQKRVDVSLGLRLGVRLDAQLPARVIAAVIAAV